jgi:hypothetical protein
MAPADESFRTEDASPCDALIVSPEQKIPELQ